MNRTQMVTLRTTAFLINEAAPHMRGRVLDVGCGSKPYKPLFHDLEWTGLDARPVAELEADMDDPIGDELYDTVLCTDSLQFSRSPQVAVANMAAALAPGGTLIITAPNVRHEDTISRWRFPLGGISELVNAAGLEIVYLDGLTGLWESEAESLRNSTQYASALPPEFRGWVAYLDKHYPMMSAVIARKP